LVTHLLLGLLHKKYLATVASDFYDYMDHPNAGEVHGNPSFHFFDESGSFHDTGIGGILRFLGASESH